MTTFQPGRNRLQPGLLLLPLLTIASPAWADMLHVSWDNDLLTGSDKGYTNGLRFSYLGASAESPTGCVTCLALHGRQLLDPLPGIGDAGSQHALAFNLRQLMVTPADITSTEPQFDDIPYVGYLAITTTLWSWSADTITGYGVSLGVVGPDSGAERGQKWVHKLTGSTNPRGWQNQLGSDTVGGIQALHGRRMFRTGGDNQLQNELLWSGGGHLSNFITSVETGLVWRTGRNLPLNFTPDHSSTSSAIGLPGTLDTPGNGWSVFIGLGAEYIPYSYLDERSEPYHFDQEPLVFQAGIGAGWHTPGFELSLTLRATSSQEKNNKEPLSFGTLSASWGL